MITGFFSSGAKSNEMFMCFVARLHEVKRNITGLTTDKINKVSERTVRERERAANVAMDLFKESRSMMGGFGGERGMFYVCFGTDDTGIKSGVIRGYTMNS